MCFTMSVVREIEDIKAAFRAEFVGTPLLSQSLEHHAVSGFVHPSWPIIYYGPDMRRRLSLFDWGLIPHWTRNREQARSIAAKTLNARSETIDSLPSFRSSVISRRCLVVADGFFEPHDHDGVSYPFYIRHRDHEMLTLGGLYAEWRTASLPDPVRTFTIVTMPAVGHLAEIHSSRLRMPAIIPPESRELWLDTAAPFPLIQELFSADAGTAVLHHLTGYPVTRDLYARGLNSNNPETLLPKQSGMASLDSLAF